MLDQIWQEDPPSWCSYSMIFKFIPTFTKPFSVEATKITLMKLTVQLVIHSHTCCSLGFVSHSKLIGKLHKLNWMYWDIDLIMVPLFGQLILQRILLLNRTSSHCISGGKFYFRKPLINIDKINTFVIEIKYN